MSYRRAAAAAALAALVASLAATSCGSKPPSVAAVEWRLESRRGDAGPAYESLSAFGSIKQDDGADSIEELWIVNDAAAISWKLTSADWTRASSGGDAWIGGSSLAMPDLGPLPRGAYRLIAVDAAGQSAESTFSVSGAFPDRAAPSVSVSQGRIAIRSDWPETLALAFDGAGSLIASPAAPKGGAALAEAFGADAAARAAFVGAYGYEPALRMGAFSPRVKTR
jgi:hypothetical protein